MAHFACELDIKRLIKHTSGYIFQKDRSESILKSGHVIICDANPRSFCYPVRYLDGVLIRHFSSNTSELLEMCKFFINNFDTKIYIANILDENIKFFREIGFNNIYKVSQLYKDRLILRKIPKDFIIKDFSKEYTSAIKKIDHSIFSSAWRIQDDDILEFCKDNYRIRLCIYNSEVVGFTIAKMNTHFSYCYIIKIAVDKNFQNRGIGKALLNDIQKILTDKKISFIFSDTIFEESTCFFNNNGFKLYSSSNLLLKD
jgi:GNAT superfamily N-acetyltransferase